MASRLMLCSVLSHGDICLKSGVRRRVAMCEVFVRTLRGMHGVSVSQTHQVASRRVVSLRVMNMS